MPAHDAQDRSENLAREPRRTVDLKGAGREESAVLGPGRQHALVEQPSVAYHPLGMLFEGVSCGGIDDRTDIGRDQRRVADRQLRHRPLQHDQQPVGDVGLQVEQPQRRAALPRTLEGRGQDIDDDLLGKRRGIDDHRVLSAGLGDQRDDRPEAAGEIEVDPPCGLSVDPVKTIPATRGSLTSGAPTASPVPGRR